jgi:cell fate regulator YaaT (PSP1 superfamily)
MAGFAEVRFKGSRRGYFSYAQLELVPGASVIVEADRGEDLGAVTALGAIAERKCSSTGVCPTPSPERRVIRLAREAEVERLPALREDEVRARDATREMVERHDLKMKITEAEWQFDRKKLIIYFTAERRVDFRELVKDLARTFRARIELKQIGVRDEAALLGGVGRCGRELCCSTWLPELKPVSLQLAKDQQLSLNPAQISGCCGRLMCCLMYEHGSYVEARRRFPREGKILRTSLGEEKVVQVDIWGERVILVDPDGTRRVLHLKELKDEVSGRDRGDDQQESKKPQHPKGGENRKGGSKGNDERGP